jgi:leucyl-tRNA synthetase
MVCHHTFKDLEGQWVYPSEVIEIEKDKFIHEKTREEVLRGRSEKMSKSKKNVVEPINIVESYGADTARLFMLSDTPASRDLDWSESGIDGAWRYVNRLWKLVANFSSHSKNFAKNNFKDFGEADLAGKEKYQSDIIKLTHRTIFYVQDELDKMGFNRSIAKIREFSNALEKFEIKHEIDHQIMHFALRNLAILISPFMPHLAEELWLNLGCEGLVSTANFPKFSSKLLQDDVVSVAIQVAGKLRAVIEMSKGLTQDQMQKLALENDNVKKFVEGNEIKKIIIVPDKLVNIVLN